MEAPPVDLRCISQHADLQFLVSKQPRMWLLTVFWALFWTFILCGGFGPPVLARQMLGYYEVAETIDEKLLLLNIARVHNEEPVHFTSTSSVAVTFDWTTTWVSGVSQ